MPTYEYECRKCGHRFEHFQSMNDPRLSRCPKPKCGGRVHRLLGTGAGIIFKGSGFYITDYRSDGYKQAQSKDSSTVAPAKTETKAESKSEAKTESPKPKETSKKKP